MAFGPLITGLVSTFFLTAFLLGRYGNPGRHHVIVTGSVFLAWYFSMLIIILMPLDVSTTAYKQCLVYNNMSEKPTHRPHVEALVQLMENQTNGSFVSSTTPLSVITGIPSHPGDLNITTTMPLPSSKPPPDSDNSTTVAPSTTPLPPPIVVNPCVKPWSYVPDNAFPVLWRIVYWSSQLLTWIVLPLMQSYSTAGDFTTTGKLKTALYENAIYYGTFLCIFVVLLIYLILHGIGLDAGKLKVVCITASNTWGLFLLVLLLGNGLVELPRTLFYRSKKGYTLRYLYFKAAKLSMERVETEEKLDEAVAELRQVNECISTGSPYRYFVDVIISKVPREKWDNDRVNHYNRTTGSGASVSEKSLVRLHKQVIKSMQGYRRVQVQWDSLLNHIMWEEDNAKNESNNTREFRSQQSYRSRGQLTKFFCTPTIEWWWRISIKPILIYGLAILFAYFTVLLMFSEMTFFIRSPMISIIGTFHRSLEGSHSYFLLELLCVVSLGYLCLCTYFTIFKMRIFNLYYLDSHQQTNEYSLIFSGMMLCRLTPPLCLNFLGMIHLDQHIAQEANRVETAYTRIMGHMDVISIVSNGFNLYFPMLICILGIATYLKWGSKILHSLGFEQFLVDDGLTTELVDEGRDLVKREKNRRQRQEENENRRRQRLQQSPSQDNATSRNRQTPSNNSPENTRDELLSNMGATQDYNSRDFVPSNTWSTNRPPVNLFDDV